MEFVLLRNGWYIENHTGSVVPAVANGAVIGAAGNGRFASASRADYAAAAAIVLTQTGHTNKTYELAGEDPYSMAEFAAELSKQAERSIFYQNLAPKEYEAALLGFGLPRMVVDVVVDADVKSSTGELNSSSRDLSKLLGRHTMKLSEALRVALKPS